MDKQRDRIVKTAGIFGLLLIIVAWLAGYASTLDSQLHKQILKNLREVSAQCVFTLESEVENQQNSLVEIAGRLGDYAVIEKNRCIAILRGLSGRYPFKRMGIAFAGGDVYTTDNTRFNISEREYFQKAMEGCPAVSQRLEDYTDGEAIVVFSTPVYSEGKVQAALFATYDVQDLARLLAVSTFNVDNIFCIVNGNGDIIVDDVDAHNRDSLNLIDRLSGGGPLNEKAAEEIAGLMDRQDSGTVKISHEGTPCYLQVNPLEINDWFLMNIIPAGVMDETRNSIMQSTYLLCFLVGALAVVFVTYLVWTQNKENRRLAKILYVDPLTGGYTYQKFLIEARKRLDRATEKAAYLVMDIDQFKLVNELFGRENADRLLVYIYGLWRRWARENDLYARRIADHYVVLAFYEKEEELLARVEDFIAALQREAGENATGYVLRPNIGVYLIQDLGEDLQSIQNNAVLAHSSVKGVNNVFYGVFDSEFKERILHSKIMEDQMEQAYRKKEFQVYYQPKYDAQTGALTGAEALVRWKKADGEMVYPNQFIPLAEKRGFIVKLDRYIFDMVCRQLQEWMGRGRRVVPVSVNLSREHLKEIKFLEEYEQIRRECGVPVEYLELELTESALVENPEMTRRVADELHRMGIKILMDDFGTGYSSLMMLKTIPIDVMKLDKSFVDDYNDPRGEKIIECVINMARSLGFLVTAEGVELEEQYELLKSLGCDTIQGYYFARPMPAEEFERLLEPGEL